MYRIGYRPRHSTPSKPSKRQQGTMSNFSESSRWPMCCSAHWRNTRWVFLNAERRNLLRRLSPSGRDGRDVDEHALRNGWMGGKAAEQHRRCDWRSSTSVSSTRRRGQARKFRRHGRWLLEIGLESCERIPYMYDVASDGADRARPIARETMNAVKDILGFVR